jgi:hypothetical protein
MALGDDVSDADAFRTVHEAVGDGRLDAGLAIGIRGGVETPPAVLEAADVVLPTPHSAARLLSAVARELERQLRPTRERIAATVPVEVATPAEPMSPDVAPPLVDDRRVEDV